MSKPHKPIRQEYIAKVRYLNSLPPPPLNPKFIRYGTTDTTTPHEENEQLLSAHFRKENFTPFIASVDDDFGMIIDPLQVRGFLDGSNERAIFANNSVPLHPSDRVLLRDAGIGNINKSEPGVSFLRRTEYIAERHSSSRGDGAGAAKTKEHEDIDPDAQLQAVERSFDAAQQSLGDVSLLRHPRKRNVRAVATWPLLPDTSMLDTKYVTVKFTGSASVTREADAQRRREGDAYDAQFHRDALLLAIYKPITSEDGEWVSMYQARDGAADVAALLASTAKEQPVSVLDDDTDVPVFRFRHTKNYDMQYQRFAKPYEELALKFAADGLRKRAAYYYPVTGRVELKKHRASGNSEINRFLAESTPHVLRLRVREPNTNELRRMDNVRSEYDPMEYEGEEEEGEDEEESKEDEEGEESKEDEEKDSGEKDLDGDVADEFDRAAEES